MEVLLATPNRWSRQPAAALQSKVSVQADLTDADVSSIRALFPSFSEDIVRDALTRCDGDAAATLDLLLIGGEAGGASETVPAMPARATEVDESLKLAMRLQQEEDEAERALALSMQPVPSHDPVLDEPFGQPRRDGKIELVDEVAVEEEAVEEEAVEEEAGEIEDPDANIPTWQPMLRTSAPSETDAARSYATKPHYNLQTSRLKAALVGTSSKPGGSDVPPARPESRAVGGG